MLLNNIIIKLIQKPFLVSILSTIILFGLMQFSILFDLQLLVLNFVLVLWTMIKNNGFVISR